MPRLEISDLVIGMGEIGKPIFEMLSKVPELASETRNFDIKDNSNWGAISPAWEVRSKYLHVCFPPTIDFINQVLDYIKQFNPSFVIVHSSLSPGMTDFLQQFAAIPILYSPVRGNVHDGMLWSLKHYTKYLAQAKMQGQEFFFQKVTEEVKIHLEIRGFKVAIVDDALSLEYAKLLDLCYYGTCIAIFQEIERIVDQKNLDYGVIKQFISSTPIESEGKVPRVLYYGGFIGGHCVIPALEKIVSSDDVELFKAVLLSNIRRQEEKSRERNVDPAATVF